MTFLLLCTKGVQIKGQGGSFDPIWNTFTGEASRHANSVLTLGGAAVPPSPCGRGGEPVAQNV